MLLDFYNKNTMQIAHLYDKFTVWLFYNRNIQMLSLRGKFLAQNGERKYDRCLESCKVRNIDFEQFLLATVYPKVDNSINIYNLVDGMMKQIGDVDKAKIQIRHFADFVRKVKIEDGGYIAHWIRTMLNSIILFDGYFVIADIAKEDVHCLCSDLVRTKEYDAHDKMMFVLQKYGFDKCSRVCNPNILHNMNGELRVQFPIYEYFDGIKHLHRYGYLSRFYAIVNERSAMFKSLSHHVELYENRQTCNALGYMHCELQKMKCDTSVEYVLADEYVVARICGFFN